MNSQELVQKLQWFQGARETVRQNRELSQMGQERQLKNLRQSEQEFQGTATGQLRQAWNDVRRRYRDIQQRFQAAEQAEGARWNYQALNYHSQVVGERLRQAETIQDAERLLNGFWNSGNRELARAAAELSGEFLRTRFGNGRGGAGLARQAEEKLAQLLDTEELQKLRGEDAAFREEVARLYKDTQFIASYYRTRGAEPVWELERLLDGVHFQEKIDAQTLGTTYHLEIDEPEPARV